MVQSPLRWADVAQRRPRAPTTVWTCSIARWAGRASGFGRRLGRLSRRRPQEARQRTRPSGSSAPPSTAASTSSTTAGTTTTARARLRMGKALRDGYRAEGLPDDEDRRPHADEAAASRSTSRCAGSRRTTSTWCSTTRSSASRTPTASSPRAARWRRLLEAKKAGKIRYIGFTGHKDPRVHLHMLEVADAARLRVRHRADAAQRDGRPLPELREAGPARAGEATASACSA